MKKEVFYSLEQPHLIGQMSGELQHLFSLYPPQQYNVNILIPEVPNSSQVNTDLLRIISEGVKIIATNDIDVVRYIHKQRNTAHLGIIERDNKIYVLVPPEQLTRLCISKYPSGDCPFRCQLPAADRERGLKLRRQIGIGDKIGVVTLHVREQGYHRSAPAGPALTYRNASIANYERAVKWLSESGYCVIRLGDKTMERMAEWERKYNYIDAPFHAEYSEFWVPYFIGTSEFYIGMLSGPYCVAQVFAVPILIANGVWTYGITGLNKGIFMPKEYWSRQVQRVITMEEIFLSPALNYNTQQQFDDSEIELRENSGEDILAAVQELRGRIKKTYVESDRIDGCIRLCWDKYRAWHRVYKPRGGHEIRVMAEVNVSHEYLKRHPEYMGNSWSNIRTDVSHNILVGREVS